MPEKSFAAFFSYVHQDDDHDSGRLSKIRAWLEGEISAQTGEPFEIFQDRDDIRWGDAWEQRINGAIDGSTFLIAAITPRYLKSAYCRKEFLRFAEREKELGRNDLILPLLYMDTQGLADEDNSVAVAISSRQYADWRSLRFEPWTNPEVTKRLSGLAKMVCDAMTSGTPKKLVLKPRTQVNKSERKENRTTEQPSEATTRKLSTSVEPITLVVDPMPYRGDFTKVMDAIQAAEPGSRILIRPGLYNEAIVLDKPLEVIGDGDRAEIVIEIKNTNVLSFKTEFGRVTNLTLRQSGNGKYYALRISQGRLELEDCDISSQSLACIGIIEYADPRLRRNYIHDGKSTGVMVQDNGKGTLEDNFIWGHNLHGVSIRGGGNPTLRRNRIYNSNQNGVFVYEDGKGLFEDNEIWDNKRAGVEVREGGSPTFRRNKITKNGYEAIWVHRNGGGIFENNDLRGNTRGAWDIDESSKSNINENDNIED